MSKWIASLPLSIAIFGFFLLSNCRYRTIDSTGEDRIVYLQVRNDSYSPQTGGLVNRAIREELLTVHSVRMTSDPANADLSVEVTILNEKVSPEIFSAEDTLQATGFGMNLVARVELSKKGSEIHTQEIDYSASTLRQGDLAQPHSRQPRMALAEGIARKVALIVINESISFSKK
ncbi:MAG: hypothetical protein VX130_00040 [Verrucomicrobiota bacterium]|nr:hypothetical protein [Verrucomicrobiota bacterium]